MIPFDVLVSGVLPYVETDATLCALRRTCRFLRDRIVMHEYPSCAKCGVSHRFRVGPRCYLSGCMCRTPFHPMITFTGPLFRQPFCPHCARCFQETAARSAVR